MTNEKNEQIEQNDKNGEEALTVEVPTEIRAGVRVLQESSCAGSSACYYIAAVATA